MARAMRPVTPWLPRMLSMLADERNGEPLVLSIAKKSTRAIRKSTRPKRSRTSGTSAVARSLRRLGPGPRVGACFGVIVSVAMGLRPVLRVAQLGQSMGVQVLAGDVGDHAPVAQHDRPVDDVREFLEVRCDHERCRALGHRVANDLV